MEQNLSIIIDKTPSLGAGVSEHIKVHNQFCTVFLQAHQEILYLKEIFQNIHSKFLDALDHLWIHPISVGDTYDTASRVSNGSGLTESILSVLGKIVMAFFLDVEVQVVIAELQLTK